MSPSIFSTEPVRLYAIAAAIVALVVHYVPSLPEPLILTLIAAILGVGGEAVRAKVWPDSHVEDFTTDDWFDAWAESVIGDADDEDEVE